MVVPPSFLVLLRLFCLLHFLLLIPLLFLLRFLLSFVYLVRFPCNYCIFECLTIRMASVRLADVNGPIWNSSVQNGPKSTILVQFGLANAKNKVRNKWSF